MDITIGTRFYKMVDKKQVECVVSDIFDITSVSRLNEITNNRVVYYAKSDNYGMGRSFEVAKATIVRGLIK